MSEIIEEKKEPENEIPPAVEPLKDNIAEQENKTEIIPPPKPEDPLSLQKLKKLIKIPN